MNLPQMNGHASIINPDAGLTCATCKHFVRGEIDPANLAGPRKGECREGVHVMAIPTRQGVQVTTLFAPVHASFPACGRHEHAV